MVTEDPPRYAIGIGAQKCASSWLHSLLATHPQVGASRPKEVDFFSYYFDRGFRWYESHFPAGKPLRFENAPSYFHDPRAPGRLRGFAPDARIIALLRDPVERAYSNHLHEVIKGHIPPVSFAEGLANNPAYVEQSRYNTHLSRWYDAFPRAQIKVIVAEEIGEDAQSLAREVFAFLGIQTVHATGLLAERRNVSDRARSPALRRVLRAGGNGMRALGLEETLTKAKQISPVRQVLAANSIDMRHSVPAMTHAERRDLLNILRPEIAGLAKLTGRNSFPWACWES